MRAKKQLVFLLLTACCFVIGGIMTFLFLQPTKKPEIQKTIADYKEPTPLPNKFKLIQSTADIKDWNVYAVEGTKFSLHYPKDIVIDSRQTVKGMRTAFIFKEDQEKTLPRNVPTLFVTNTKKRNTDGLTLYKYSDCTKPCAATAETVGWVNINETVMGIKNPRQQDIINYYITDKNMQNPVINVYLGNVQQTSDAATKKKIKQLEEIATTIKVSQ